MDAKTYESYNKEMFKIIGIYGASDIIGVSR